MTDTIYALASGADPAAIAVIRISGPAVGDALRDMVGRTLIPQRASLSHLRHPRTGETLDQALAIWFPGPASYTGENYLELHIHGGRAVVAAILRALGSLDGYRLAEPGEFSRRALLNGKTDLAALEGLADLVAARTEAQRRQAIAHASGYLSDRVVTWRQKLIGALAHLEAEIDFADEGDVPEEASRRAAVPIEEVSADLAVALTDSERAEIIREGFVVVIAGAPNVGKSSLLNFLAKRDVAIVTEIPGTTRDIIEVKLDLGGHEVVLIDTAGLRETEDPVEMEGIRRAREAIKRAHMTLWLSDSVSSLPPAEAVQVRTKADLFEAREGPHHWVSTRTGEGMAALLARIGEEAKAFSAGPPALVTRQRHREAIESATARLALAAQNNLALEIRAEELRLAARDLDSIIGTVGVEDMLDALFSQFCIGK